MKKKKVRMLAVALTMILIFSLLPLSALAGEADTDTQQTERLEVDPAAVPIEEPAEELAGKPTEEPTVEPVTEPTPETATDIEEASSDTVLTEGAVTVSGQIPDGGYLSVTEIALDEATEYVDSGTTVLFAYDIKILLPGDPEPTEYQPPEGSPITVTIAPQTPIETPVEVVHVAEDEVTGEITPEVVANVVTTQSGAVEFEAEGFSIYIGTTATEMTYPAVMYYNGSGFFSDEACTEAYKIVDSQNAAFTRLSALASAITGTTTIYMKAAYPVTDTESIGNATYAVTLKRWAQGLNYISINTNIYGGNLITVADSGNLTLNRVALDGGAVWKGSTNETLDRDTVNTGITAAAAMIHVDGTLTVNDGAILQCNSSEFTTIGGSGIYLDTTATMTMNGGIIRWNTATAPNATNDSGGSAIFSKASSPAGSPALTINGGGIYGNHTKTINIYWGGAVQLTASTMSMTGGEIYNNYCSNGSGGGIAINTGSSLTVSGGSIHNNSAPGSAGGGIYSFSSTGGNIATGGNCTVTISGGSISNNYGGGNGGGGLYLSSGGVGACTITGGVISGNKCADSDEGGAIYAGNNNVVMSGGNISADNMAGSTTNGFSFASGKLILSGSATITAPITCGTNHVYVSDTLTGRILVTPSAHDNDTVFAYGNCSALNLGYNNYTLTDEDAHAFTIMGGAENTSYYAAKNASNQMTVQVTALSLSLSANPTSVTRGGISTITPTVTNGGNYNISWDILYHTSADTVVSGSNYAATLTIGSTETSSSITVCATLTSGDIIVSEMVTVTISDASSPTFTIIIPETISTNTGQSNFTIEGSLAGFSTGDRVTVTVASANDFTLVGAGESLAYTLYPDEWPRYGIPKNGVAATFTTNGPASERVYCEIGTPAYSGTYTDTLTFTVTMSGS